MTRKYMDPQKSTIRKTFINTFPHCVKTGSRSNLERDLPDVIVLDMLQYIKCVYPDSVTVGPSSNGDHPTGGEGEEGDVPFTYNGGGNEGEKLRDYGSAVNYLVNVIKKAVISSLERDHINPFLKNEKDNGSVLTVVISIDKYRFVCPARTVVHRKRTKKERDLELKKGEFKEPKLNQLIQYPFEQITEDKGHNSSVLFRFLMIHIISKLSKLNIFDSEVNYIFDGHCLDEDDPYGLADIDFTPDSGGPDKEPLDTYSTPLILRVYPSSNNDDSKPQLKWLHCMHNCIGESDFLPFFYLKKHGNTDMSTWTKREEPKKTKIDIYSIDTDSFLYSLIYLCMREVDSEIIDDINLQFERIAAKKEPKWMNCNEMADSISSVMSKEGGSRIMYPALQLAVSALSVGSDYTEKHFKVTQEHFIHSYMENCYVIGNLVNIAIDKYNFCKLRLNGPEYTRFIALGYAHTHKDQKAWKDFNPFDYSHGEKNSLYGAVRKKLVELYPLADTYWLPTNEDIILSAKQFQYYMNMVGRLGKGSVDIELQDSDLMVYGYTRTLDEDNEREITVRAIHTLTEEQIRKETISVIGLKKTDNEEVKLNNKRKKAEEKKREKLEAKENGNGAPKRNNSNGGGVRGRKKQKVEPEFVEGIDLD